MPPAVISKPASPAAPPDPPVKANPVISNWKPAIEPPKSYKISKEPDESKAPKLSAALMQLNPSPPQIPQSSTTRSP